MPFKKGDSSQITSHPSPITMSIRTTHTYLLVLLATYLLVQCMPPTSEPVLTEINRNIADPLFQKIIYFQDYQLSDSLLPYFKHKDPTYRYAAALAFASFKKEKAIDSLGPLLKDPIMEVRMAAAYALGQQGETKGANLLTGNFEQSDTAGTFLASNSAILEAVGKCGSQDFLSSLGSISTYKHTDTLLLEGQAKGIYRYALRGMIAPEGTSKMLEFVNGEKFPTTVRFIAANYLARAKNIEISNNAIALITTFEAEKDPRIRMALAKALGKINRPVVSEFLLRQLGKEADYRVTCNIIRALKTFNYAAVKGPIGELIDDPNPHIAQVAAEYFVSNGTAQDARSYRDKAKSKDYPWSIRTTLYEAANRHLPAYMINTIGAVNGELREQFRISTNPYERASILKALTEYGWNYKYLIELFPSLTTVVERTASVEALAKITNNLDFYKFFKGSSNRVSREIGREFIKSIRSQDVGMMAVAAGALRNKNIDFRTLLLDSLPTIKKAQQLLDLPRSIETFNELQKTINYFEEKPLGTPKSVALNHPLDTSSLAILKKKPAALIQTNKGNIKVQLLPFAAPGSVLNFINLADDKFYNGKKFHRVVPNFVIQGGCPRGDGYGSLDYTIRSELPMQYYDQQGYVGMASAGLHTEGTQFFITHSPTPHLDGKYTIFGKVTDGMDVVHEIIVGDSIQEVKISYF